jgi:hypothetical protein
MKKVTDDAWLLAEKLRLEIARHAPDRVSNL